MGSTKVWKRGVNEQFSLWDKMMGVMGYNSSLKVGYFYKEVPPCSVSTLFDIGILGICKGY